MRNLKFLLIFVCLTVNVTLAQDHPSVEIVLNQPTAHLGDTINADIYVHNGVNVGGVDIGIIADEDCLRILERQAGGYLPTTDAEGAFSAFSELNDHDTRLAAALIDRTKYVNGHGIFYKVGLEVTCEKGIAPLTVSYAQVSSYIDPNAEIIDVIAYDLDKGTLTASNTQLEIVTGEPILIETTSANESTEQVTLISTDVTAITEQATLISTDAAAITEQATIVSTDVTTATEQATAVPTSTLTPTVDESQPATDSQDQTAGLIALLLIVIGVVGLILLFVINRRNRRNNTGQ